MLIIKVSLEKTVSGWSEDGCDGKYRSIFFESDTLDSGMERESVNAKIEGFLVKYGLDFSKFERVEDWCDDARYDFCDVEDDSGNSDEDGKWLADYSLSFQVFKTTEVTKEYLTRET